MKGSIIAAFAKMCQDVPRCAKTVHEMLRCYSEATWSDQARLAQRQPGYEWTKTFKATVQRCGGVTYCGVTYTHGYTWYIWSRRGPGMVPPLNHCGSRRVLLVMCCFFFLEEIRSTENSTKHIMRGRRQPCKRRWLCLSWRRLVLAYTA